MGQTPIYKHNNRLYPLAIPADESQSLSTPYDESFSSNTNTTDLLESVMHSNKSTITTTEETTLNEEEEVEEEPQSNLYIDDSCLNSIMDDLESEIDDFDLAMMSNANKSLSLSPSSSRFKKNAESSTPVYQPHPEDIFNLSPTPNQVVELESVLEDIMRTAA